MLTGVHWGFWEWERVIAQPLILLLVVYSIYTVRVLIRHGRADRQARELVLKELKKTAEDLSQRTAAIAEALAGKTNEQFQALEEKVSRATEASATAAEVANSVNEKIDETNRKLLAHVKKCT